MTASGASNLINCSLRKAIIQVNAALTGTITVSDETGTSGTPVVAVITNPTVGSSFTYGNFKTGVTVNPSATCDITVSLDTSQGPL
jgi:hypothetical protein